MGFVSVHGSDGTSGIGGSQAISPLPEKARRFHLIQDPSAPSFLSFNDLKVLNDLSDSIPPVLLFYCLLTPVSCILVWLDLFCPFSYHSFTVFGPGWCIASLFSTGLGLSNFGDWNFFRASDFVLRIWQRLRRMLIEEA